MASILLDVFSPCYGEYNNEALGYETSGEKQRSMGEKQWSMEEKQRREIIKKNFI